jgi:hypothetical protein
MLVIGDLRCAPTRMPGARNKTCLCGRCDQTEALVASEVLGHEENLNRAVHGSRECFSRYGFRNSSALRRDSISHAELRSSGRSERRFPVSGFQFPEDDVLVWAIRLVYFGRWTGRERVGPLLVD